MTISERLSELGSDKYRDFQSKLVPNIPKETILGIKTPAMRKIAKDIRGTNEADAFLAELPHKYYEENLVNSHCPLDGRTFSNAHGSLTVVGKLIYILFICHRAIFR